MGEAGAGAGAETGAGGANITAMVKRIELNVTYDEHNNRLQSTEGRNAW